ncbi:ankyrin repeat-containing domain protein, partial [Baffinella frigidus]
MLPGVPLRRTLVILLLACTSLSPVPALRLPQREEPDGALDSDRAREGDFRRLGLRSKLALPDAANPRVAGQRGTLDQVSPFGLRPNGLSLLSDSAGKELREDAADGDRTPHDILPAAAAEDGTGALAAWGGADIMSLPEGGAAVGAWTGGGLGVWNAMLANAHVGMMAQGRLLVEPTLNTASNEVVRAALRGDVDGLRAALGDGHGALEAKTSPAGETPLMLATISGNPDAVGLLLARGADPNARDLQGWTALMKAVALDDERSVAVLLSAGADSEAQNHAGGTALTIAIAWRKRNIAQLLLAARS